MNKFDILYNKINLLMENDNKPLIKCSKCNKFIKKSDIFIDNNGLQTSICKECATSDNIDECCDAGVSTVATNSSVTAGETTGDALGPLNPNNSYAATTDDARIPAILGLDSRQNILKRKKNKK